MAGHAPALAGLAAPPAAAVYTDGVHLSLDHADWITPGPPGRADWSRFEAVHGLARRIGLRRCWFQHRPGSYPHYDLTTPAAALRAVEAGALLLADWKDYARLAAAPGSRLRPEGWRPVAVPAADALAAVGPRHVRLMALFAPRRVRGRAPGHPPARRGGLPG